MYGAFSKSLPTRSTDREGEIMTQILECLQNPNVHVFIFENLVELEKADYIGLLFKYLKMTQSILEKLIRILPFFGMRFATSTYKFMFQDVSDGNTYLEQST